MIQTVTAPIVLIILLFPLFIASCQSTNESETPLFNHGYYKNLIEKSCFSNDKGSFLIQLSFPESPTVSWEGMWFEHFSKIKLQLLDPFGQAIDIPSISEIAAKFGPYGLRSVMCGKTAFESKLKMDNHKIGVKSKIKVIRINNEETVLETESKFYYGLFTKKNTNTLFWRGRIQNEHVTPELIRFGSDNDFIILDFIDYE